MSFTTYNHLEHPIQNELPLEIYAKYVYDKVKVIPLVKKRNGAHKTKYIPAGINLFLWNPKAERILYEDESHWNLDTKGFETVSTVNDWQYIGEL